MSIKIIIAEPKELIKTNLKSALNKIVPSGGKQFLTDWMITPFSKRGDFPEKLTVYHKIMIFYERVIGWQIDIANIVANGIKDETGKVLKCEIKDSGYAVLNILLSYFEMIGKYNAGYLGEMTRGTWQDNSSKKHFKEGVGMVFPEFKKYPWLPRKLYTNVRCGLYHHGMTEGGIILTGESNLPIKPTDEEWLIINPHLLVLKLKDHFESYIEQIINDQNLRVNFEKRFDYENK